MPLLHEIYNCLSFNLIALLKLFIVILTCVVSMRHCLLKGFIIRLDLVLGPKSKMSIAVLAFNFCKLWAPWTS